MKRLFVLRTVLIAITGVAAFAVSMPAQVANNTALVGTVLDSAGSAVVGVKVTAVEASTGVVFPGTTNAQGYYSIKLISGHIRHHCRADWLYQGNEDRHDRAH